MHDPFSLDDALVRDLPHARVVRHAPQDGGRCIYEKTYKAEGLPEAEYWTRRENALLADFVRKGLKHTAEPAGDGPEDGAVRTYDAGPTLEDWLRTGVADADGELRPHPFKRADQFLRLLRACLVALKEIHSLGVVHCDLRADAICLPYAPLPEEGEGEPRLRIDFEGVKLLEFAFAAGPLKPLKHPLPIWPDAPYQSKRLKEALAADLRGGADFLVRQLSWRTDIFSLGHIVGQIVGAGLDPAPGEQGITVMRGAHDAARRLQNYGIRHKSRDMPHDILIAEIDGLLRHAQGIEDAFRRLPAGAAEPAVAPLPPTPIIPPEDYRPAPRRQPLIAKLPRARLPTLKTLSLWLAAAGIAGAAAWGGYALLRQARHSPAAPAAETAAAGVAESAATTKGKGTIQEAMQFIRDKNYPQAASTLQGLAAVGNAEAQNRLGYLFEAGLGVAKDEKQAAEWYRKAADQGYAAGQTNLGALYALGKGVEKSEEQAAAWFRKAAEQGDARGQSNLGVMYEYGKGGLPQDPKEAAKWYAKAADQNYAPAQYNLGVMYERGAGVERDLAQSIELLNAAAAQGNLNARRRLGLADAP